MNKIRIKSGTSVFKSELGHRNFHYPTDSLIQITEDCTATTMSWVGSNTCTAIMIPAKAIGYDIDNYTIVWIMNDYLKKGAQRLRQGK
tara:strand:- start:53 stop:316 length:264 start_codon:yes stop_codon:yes gene_type:complete